MFVVVCLCLLYVVRPVELIADRIDVPQQIRVEEVLVPEYGVIGKHASMRCIYSPPTSIYSVRWYKNGREFYSYLPGKPDPITVHKTEGITVDVSKSSSSAVYLTNLTLDSTGRYRCEVSGEGPFFPTDTRYEDMLVVALPDRGPRIRGAKRRYSEGDTMNVNCTAIATNPPVNLTWYINRRPVAEPMLIRYPVFNISRDNNNTLHSTVLGLSYTVQRRDFKVHHERLKLKCVAFLYDVYYKATEVSVERNRPHHHRSTPPTTKYDMHRRVQGNGEDAHRRRQDNYNYELYEIQGEEDTNQHTADNQLQKDSPESAVKFSSFLNSGCSSFTNLTTFSANLATFPTTLATAFLIILNSLHFKK